MNIDNMKRLRRQLVRLSPDQFDMSEWVCHPEDVEDRPELASRVQRCGTVACIAGWAALLNGGPADYEIKTWAGDWLELTGWEANHLFYGHWAKDDEGRRIDSLSDITLDGAIAELDSLLSQAKEEVANV